MARFLSWEHLSRDQIAALRLTPKDPGAPTARQLLRQYVADQLTDDQLQNDTILDLYSYALRQGQDGSDSIVAPQAWGLEDEKLSCLFGMLQEVHTASINQRLTIERSFAFFKDTLINHSIQRPPFSIGVFSQVEIRQIMDWMLSTYYRHYKMYQYAFTSRVTMSITTYHPSSLVEQVPQLPPLAEALTEEQHQQQLGEQQKQEDERRKAEEAAAAVAAEEARVRALQEEYEASLPEDIKDKVQAVLQREVAYLGKKMEEQFQAQHQGLLLRLAELEAAAKATARPATAAKASNATNVSSNGGRPGSASSTAASQSTI